MKLYNIKIKIVQVLIIIINWILSFIYFLMKLRPAKRYRVVFCSRQSNVMTIDFILLKKEIERLIPEATFVAIMDHVTPNIKGYIKFVISVLKSMWYLATAEICILDSYWPAVSMLKHKKNLKVIQIWHAIGKMKKSGYQTIDKKSGRNGSYTTYLKMHKNYDYFIGGAPFWNEFYKEAFNINDNQILNYGLPRIDYLIKTAEENRQRFLSEFPELVEKKIVLYAPTFRKNMESHWEEITRAAIHKDIRIIIKNHPEQWANKTVGDNIIYIDNWNTMDLIAVCDYMITDYSSIALEAAVLKKPTFFWTYDYDEYMKNSGTNIDLKEEVPDNMSDNINDILHRIENDDYNTQEQLAYIKKFLPKDLGGCTYKIAKKIVDLMMEDRKVI